MPVPLASGHFQKFHGREGRPSIENVSSGSVDFNNLNLAASNMLAEPMHAAMCLERGGVE